MQRVELLSGALDKRLHVQLVEDIRALQARFEAARTQLTLAEIAEGLGDRAMAATQVTQAYIAFTDLRVPVYIHRAKQLADGLGLPLVLA